MMITKALDHDRIYFDSVEDVALFHGLLACSLHDGEDIKVYLMTRQ